MPIFKNLVTNPGFETAAGTVELRRNLLKDPDLLVVGQWAVSMTGSVALASGNRLLLTGTAAGASRLGVIQTLDSAKPAGTYRLSVNLEAGHASLTQARIYLFDTITSTIRATGLQTLAASGNNRYDFTLTTTDVFNRVYIEMVGTGLPAGVTGYINRPLLEAGSVGGAFFSPGQGAGGADRTSTFVGAANTTESVLTATRAVGVNTAVANAYVHQSTEWAASGTKSLKIDPNGASTSSYGSVVLSGLTAGATYTAIAKLRLTSAQAGSVHASWFRRLMAQSTGMPVNNVISNAAPNEVGVHEVRVTFTLGASTTVTLFLMNGSLATPIWVDELALVPGVYEGPYFDGNTVGATWDGPANASASTWIRTFPELAVDTTGNPFVEVFFDPASFDIDVSYIEVWRYSEDREWKVRGGVNITPGVAALDFEAPFNIESSYRAKMFTATGGELGWTEAASVTLEYQGTVVHQPLDPTAWVSVDVMPGSVAPLDRPESGELVNTEGGDVGVWIGSGRRGLRDVRVSLQARDIATADRFRDLQGSYTVRQIGILCIRTTSRVRWPRTFFGRGDFAENDRTVRFGGERLTFDARVDEVAPPFPGLAVPLLTYDDLDAAYASYDARDAAYPSYTDMDRDYTLAGLAG